MKRALALIALGLFSLSEHAEAAEPAEENILRSRHVCVWLAPFALAAEERRSNAEPAEPAEQNILRS